MTNETLDQIRKGLHRLEALPERHRWALFAAERDQRVLGDVTAARPTSFEEITERFLSAFSTVEAELVSFDAIDWSRWDDIYGPNAGTAPSSLDSTGPEPPARHGSEDQHIWKAVTLQLAHRLGALA